MHIGIRFDYTSVTMDRGCPMTEAQDPEHLWSRLLSGEPDRIRGAWKSLGAAEQERVRRHLQTMAEEPGWQPGQRKAARAALDCLQADRDGQAEPDPKRP
ncbi:MAG: hypothetical protein A3K46_04800 [Chloroflexi bacterium RBG_13_60_9]|nr:MAG: hypothetical protein A3K46_04800 [Chloroflexi bacterium RBG_13_60_9]